MSERYNLVVVWLFAVLMLGLSVYSLYLGISPHDEAFYITIPYRFILGDRPYIDEFNLAQNAGFFVLPFLKLFLYFQGSTEGVILFARYLQ